MLYFQPLNKGSVNSFLVFILLSPWYYIMCKSNGLGYLTVTGHAKPKGYYNVHNHQKGRKKGGETSLEFRSSSSMFVSMEDTITM